MDNKRYWYFLCFLQTPTYITNPIYGQFVPETHLRYKKQAVGTFIQYQNIALITKMLCNSFKRCDDVLIVNAKWS